MANPQYFYTIKQDTDGRWRARFWGNYGRELIWWTEGYYSTAGAQNAIDLIKWKGANAPVL